MASILEFVPVIQQNKSMRSPCTAHATEMRTFLVIATKSSRGNTEHGEEEAALRVAWNKFRQKCVIV